MTPLRIVLAGGGTGGHLYPALNIAEALGRADPDAQFLFIGSQRGLEARVLPETGYPYHLLPLQPLYRQRPWRNWRLLWGMPAVAVGIAREFRRFDPHLVVGTGGYVSGPAVAWGRLKGRRTAIQEQNAQPGLVTRLLSARVDQLHLGYPEAESRLRVSSRTRVFAFGNPVSKPLLPAGTEPYAWPRGRVLLVVGGSQGAKGLNDRLLADLERAASNHSVESTVAVEARSGPRARRGPPLSRIRWAARGPRTCPWCGSRVRLTRRRFPIGWRDYRGRIGLGSCLSSRVWGPSSAARRWRWPGRGRCSSPSSRPAVFRRCSFRSPRPRADIRRPTPEPWSTRERRRCGSRLR